MATLRRLDPHDPVPESGRFLLVLRRFGEDDPRAIVLEIVTADGAHVHTRVAMDEAGHALSFADATQAALDQAAQDGFDIVLTLDRTAGPREQLVQSHGGDHSVDGERLADTDPEDNVTGNDIRDRPHDAGFIR